MNQILDYEPSGNSGKSGGSDKIVRVFAIILIIFALAVAGVVGYSMVSNKEKVTSEAESVTHAQISVEKEDNSAVIEVTHDKKIVKLIYSWNTNSERTVSASEKYVTQKVDIPAGDNVLHIKVIDENNVETTYEKEFSAENGVDIINPVIELEVTEEKKLKITATDETALDFITYRWNDSDEETIYADEGSKEIVQEIEILKGENDLVISAVDSSKNTTTETKSFTGLTKPEVKVTLSEDGSSIDIKATHENGIKEVKYNFNDKDYNVDIGDGTPTEIQFAQPLNVGKNRIILKVISVDGTDTTFDGECNYGNEETSSNDNNEENNEEDSNRESSDESEDTNEDDE